MADGPDPNVLLSDPERRQAVDALFTAHREGRIDLDDLDRRLRSAYAARTVGDLSDPLTGLPWPLPRSPRVQEVERIDAGGGLSRTGRWTASRWTRIEQPLYGGGAVLLDLSDADVPFPRIDVELLLGTGGYACVVVPRGSGVDLSGVTGRGRPARPRVPAEPDPGGLQVVVVGSAGKRAQVRARHPGDQRWWEPI